MNILQIYVHFLNIKLNCVHFLKIDGHKWDLAKYTLSGNRAFMIPEYSYAKAAMLFGKHDMLT
jgi:hypothetical protein